MLGHKRLEVQFNIEALLFIDAIMVVSWVLPLFFNLQDPTNYSSAVSITVWGLLVIFFVSITAFVYIYFIELPRRLQRRFEFNNEAINWDGPLSIPDRLHLLAPGYEGLGLLPSWKCGTAVPMALLANLIMNEVVEIAVPRKKDGTPRRASPAEWLITRSPNASPSETKGDADPIALAVLERFLNQSTRESNSIRQWRLITRNGRISLNGAILARLIHKGFLQETTPRRVGIFKQPSFTLTEAGQACHEAILVQRFLQEGTMPGISQDLFLLYLACSGVIGLPKKPRKEATRVTKLAAKVKEALPASLKSIADAIEQFDNESETAVVAC